MRIEPVFIWYTDCGWFTLSPWQLRSTQMSSACPAMCGRKSLISRPDWPRGRNGLIGPSSGLPATLRRVITSPKLPGNGWPAYLARSGLGSNKSMWLGPPCMNSQMTRLARGAKCGCRGASGSVAPGQAARASCCIRPAKAKPPIPPPAFSKNCRRSCRCGKCA